MYKSSLDIIEQHGFTEGSKYNELIKLNLEQKKNESECYSVLVEKYNLMKPKEFKSKWNRFQRISPKVEFVK
tara:strand:- start:115 stop:330 length:216 start_codon:yes stop_codon:yes gene_type:complete